MTKIETGGWQKSNRNKVTVYFNFAGKKGLQPQRTLRVASKVAISTRWRLDVFPPIKTCMAVERPIVERFCHEAGIVALDTIHDSPPSPASSFWLPRELGLVR
jgi:hypothetical protein